MLTTLLLGFATHLGALGPLALIGGPVGVAIAWIGSLFASKTAKWLAIVIGLMLIVAVTVGLTVHLEHLEADAKAYRALSAEVVSLQGKYGCTARPVHEQELSACLTARERDVEQARAHEIALQRLEAAKEQAELDRQQRKADLEAAATQRFIEEQVRGHDGPVPQILRDTWARERRERGVK